jgi:large subunit ribosomal protein L23
MNSNEKILAVLRAPHVSEKTARAQETNQYVFEVAQDATKADAVNVVNVKGKTKAFRFRTGRRGDWRKAYVKLAEGQSIDLMAKA